jgi:AraC-like DNA-binding protein
MRQAIVTENDPVRGVSIAALARDYSRGARVAEHAHGSDQLVYASSGIMEIASGEKLWVLPPHFGLWIPARVRHNVRMPEHVSMRALYLRPGLHRIWRECTVFHVAPLLRELILEIVRLGTVRTRNHVERAMRDLLVALLRRATPAATSVSMPRDLRALAVARVVLDDPSVRFSLAGLCSDAGLSVRTLQRVFRREVGINFEAWRRQVRLMKAVQFLVSGRTVKETAYAVGYEEPSAFVALFRATFGATPKAWISSIERI